MTFNGSDIRILERQSIRDFIEASGQSGFLQGRLLDFGCGRQPYRDLVEGYGVDYVGYDRVTLPGNVSEEDLGPGDPLGLAAPWDTILCNQVIQYVQHPRGLLEDFYFALKPGGWLVLTGPTNWQEVEVEDLFRFTQSGIRYLLEQAGYDEIRVESRACVPIHDWKLSLGWGALARR